MLRRPAALALAIASLGVSACGQQSTELGEEGSAESEALYVDLAGLKYQVQLSRQLNPEDPTDKAYFQNVDPAESTLEEGNVWFGVFMRAENETNSPHAAARDFLIEDTQGNEFEPIPSKNTFSYQPAEVPAKGYLPNPEALQAQAGTFGSLLLFQLPYETLDNRPLELKITSPDNPEEARSIDLDV